MYWVLTKIDIKNLLQAWVLIMKKLVFYSNKQCFLITHSRYLAQNTAI